MVSVPLQELGYHLYLNFGRPLKSCDIILSTDVLTHHSILSIKVQVRAYYHLSASV
jgi:hypothetical protein